MIGAPAVHSLKFLYVLREVYGTISGGGEKNMIDTVIFDMDGTLLDTLEDLKDAVNVGLAEGGYPERTLEEIRSFVGNGVWKLMEHAVPDGTAEADIKKCLDAFKRFYAEHWQDKTKPYVGILFLLDHLKAAGIKIGVISNKYEEAVLQLCKDYFPGRFDAARGEREGVPRKPAPDGIFSMLEELDSAKENTVYVGDSEVDMATAKNAGLAAIGVTWGFRDRELLQKEGADYLIDAPEELLQVIRK